MLQQLATVSLLKTEEFEQGTYRFFDYESTWWGPYLTNIIDPSLIAPLYIRPNGGERIRNIDRSESPFELSNPLYKQATLDSFRIRFHPQYRNQISQHPVHGA